MLDNARFEELLDGHFRGDLTVDEMAELAAAAQADEGLRQRLIQGGADHLALTEILGRPLPDLPTFPPESALDLAAPRRFAPWAWVAAAAAVVATVIVVNQRNAEEPLGPWPVDRTEASAGDILVLSRTEVKFREPSAFTVRPPDSNQQRPTLDLTRGSVDVKTHGDAPGLLLKTPAGILRDIGTEFSVRVAEGSDTMTASNTGRAAALVSILVTAGLVEWTPTEPAPIQVLRPEMGSMKLRASGGLGEVEDRQGLVQIRSREQARWTVARQHRRLQPGDLLRTGNRGAHAATIRLDNGVILVAGPGTEFEILDAASVRILRGEVEVAAPTDGEVSVAGPDGRPQSQKGTAVFSVRNGVLAVLGEAPRWLTGYRKDAVTDALGALLANVDGRITPLSIRWHKAQVDIRDRIARTTIDQEFVNETGVRLEGTFYFPLPANASVSGFAMWVGDEKVHGEVVEKARAREIYETILREKRDPGLLEWTGGNLFRARVFPIDSSKRIQITYTEVLPRTDTGFAYRYALRSDLLRSNPLQSLAVDVRVSSTDEIVSVTCPSHGARITHTAHGARVEYDDQEVVPDQDLEILFETGRPSSDAPYAVVTGHQRGDDGYFLTRIGLPANSNTAPSDGPRNVVILADTSASVRDVAREAQIAFVEALLAGLDDRDRVQLLTADVSVRAAFPGSVAATDAHRRSALAHLVGRRPLGWTDLGAAFEAALAHCGPETHLVYVGDGIVTHGPLDAAALLEQVRAAWNGRGTMHTVGVGSTYDALRLGDLPNLGRGSFRLVSEASQAPEEAEELLASFDGPGLRDLRLTFDGVDVAAVHPTQVSYLRSGDEILVVGRFDAKSSRRVGTLRLQAQGPGGAVDETFPIDLTPSSEAESFVPRLWARQELDALLRSGSSATTQKAVIRLSEDYQIITPYTSLLVLESDEDRERFGVEKRLRMRDGEEYFAKGAEDAAFALTQQAIQTAKSWQRDLQAKLLKQLRDMGRGFMGELAGPEGSGVDILERQFGIADQLGAPLDKSVMTVGGVRAGLELTREHLGEGWEAPNEELEALVDFESRETDKSELFFLDGLAAQDSMNGFDDDARFSEVRRRITATLAYNRDFDVEVLGRASVRLRSYTGIAGERLSRWAAPHFDPDSLWPGIPSAGLAYDAPSRWDPEVLALVRSVNRRARLETAGQWAIQAQTRITRGGRAANDMGTSELFVGPLAWWQVPQHRPGENVTESWMLNGEMRALDRRFGLGRKRPATPSDRNRWQMPFVAWFDDFARSYNRWEAVIAQRDGELVTVRIAPREESESWVELVIDRSKDALVRFRQGDSRAVTQVTEFQDLAQVGGVWWPRRITTTFPQSELRQDVEVTVRSLDQETLDATLASRSANTASGTFLGTLPSVGTARAQRRAGTNTLENAWVSWRALAMARRDEVAAPLADAVLAQVSELGRERVRLAMALHQGQEALALQIVQRLAAELARAERRSDLGAAQELLGMIHRFSSSEQLGLTTTLRTIADRRESRMFRQSLDEAERRAHLAASHGERAFAALQRMIERYPDDLDVHRNYANALVQRHEVDRALAHLAAVAQEPIWSTDERYLSLAQRMSILEGVWRLEEATEAYTLWATRESAGPRSTDHDSHLSRLVRLDQADRADELMAQWIDAALQNPLDRGHQERLAAALSHILSGGRGFRYPSAPLDPKWQPRLTALLSKSQEPQGDQGVAHTLFMSARFRDCEAGRQAMRDLHRLTAAELATAPWSVMERRLEWLAQAFPSGLSPDLQSLVQKLVDRFREGTEPDPADVVHRIVNRFASVDTRLQYLQHRTGSTDLAIAQGARSEWLQLILSLPWTPERQELAFTVLKGIDSAIADPADPREGTRRQAVALWQVNNWISTSRVVALLGADPDRTELTRRALAERRREHRKTAHAELEVRLSTLESEVSTDLAPWVTLERLWFQSRQGKLGPDGAQAAWGILKPLWAQIGSRGPEDQQPSDVVLARRAVETLMAIAVLENEPTVTEELVAFLTSKSAADQGPFDPVLVRIQHLLAMGNNDGLRELLTSLREDPYRGPLALRLAAHVAAESGDLAAAIQLMMDAGQEEPLDPSDSRLLAQWHTALGNQERANAAAAAELESQDEWTLRSWIYNVARPTIHPRGDSPEPLDRRIPMALELYVRKTTQLHYAVGLVEEIYTATRDFRVLTALVQGTLGKTSGTVYGGFSSIRRLLEKIQEEATLDRLITRVDDLLSTGVVTDPDRRALALIGVFCRAAATAQSSGTTEHEREAIRYLNLARMGEFAPGDRYAVSQIAFDLEMRSPAVRDAILAWGRELHDQEPATGDRHWIARELAGALASADKANESRLLRESTLAQIKATYGGSVPDHLTVFLTDLATALQAAGQGRQGEALLRADLANAPHESRRRWAELAVADYLIQVFKSDGEAISGRGADLWRNLDDELDAALRKRSNPEYALSLWEKRKTLWTISGAPSSDLRDRVRAFAFSDLPAILDLYRHGNCRGLVAGVGEQVRRILGDQLAVEFFVIQAETQPAWLARVEEDFWRYHGWQMSRAFAATGHRTTANLDARVLGLTLTEIRRDMRNRDSRHRELYQTTSEYYWRAQHRKFLETAQEVLADPGLSDDQVHHIAHYLFHDLAERGAGIDALWNLHRRVPLPINGQRTLIHFLMQAHRWADAVLILKPLNEAQPKDVDFAADLIRCAHRAGQSDLARTTLARSTALLDGEAMPEESALAALAEAAQDATFRSEATDLFRRAINVRTRGDSSRLRFDERLAHYYRRVSQLLADRGDTGAAVDAAAAVILCSSRNVDQRREARKNLENVIRRSEDLDAYIRAFEAEVQKTGLENPIVRQAIGQVLMDQGRHEVAARHLDLAVAASPEDAELAELAATAWEKAGKLDLAAERRRESAFTAVRDMPRWRALAESLARMGQPEEAKRAWATGMEVLPDDTPGLELYAEYAQAEGAFAEALNAWERVQSVRPKEAHGLLGMADNLIRLGRMDEARQVVTQLKTGTFDPEPDSLATRIRELESRLR